LIKPLHIEDLQIGCADGSDRYFVQLRFDSNKVVSHAGLVNTLANAQVPADDKDANDGIHIHFVRKHGAQAWTKFDQMQAGAKAVSSVAGSQIGMTPIEGLGDKAYVLPAGVGVMVLKGDAFNGRSATQRGSKPLKTRGLAVNAGKRATRELSS
jgi:hypothetical protein